MPSPPSTRPSDARGRRSSAFVREPPETLRSVSDPEASTSLVDGGWFQSVDRRDVDGGTHHFTVVSCDTSIGQVNAVLESNPDQIAVQGEAQRHDAEHVAPGGGDT